MAAWAMPCCAWFIGLCPFVTGEWQIDESGTGRGLLLGLRFTEAACRVDWIPACAGVTVFCCSCGFPVIPAQAGTQCCEATLRYHECQGPPGTGETCEIRHKLPDAVRCGWCFAWRLRGRHPDSQIRGKRRRRQGPKQPSHTRHCKSPSPTPNFQPL